VSEYRRLWSQHAAVYCARVTTAAVAFRLATVRIVHAVRSFVRSQAGRRATVSAAEFSEFQRSVPRDATATYLPERVRLDLRSQPHLRARSEAADKTIPDSPKCSAVRAVAGRCLRAGPCRAFLPGFSLGQARALRQEPKSFGTLWYSAAPRLAGTILSRRPSSGPALACTPLSPVFGSDAKPSAAPHQRCCVYWSCMAHDALGSPCQSARIFCRTLPGCAAVGFVAPIICSTHAEQCLASRWSLPRQPPLIRELTRTGRGAALCAFAAAAQRWRCSPARSAACLCRLVPHSIAATGAPFLGSPSTLWHGCQTQPPSSVSAPSPDALPSRRRSPARRSPARRSPARHICPSSEGSGGACAPAVVNFSRIAM
jgi:hypothetical protein